MAWILEISLMKGIEQKTDRRMRRDMYTKGGNMKRFSILAMAFAVGMGIFLTGCQNEGSQLTAPDEPAASSTPMFVELPNEPDLAKALYDEEYVSKAWGGNLTVSYSSFYSRLRVYMNVHFEPGSVSQDFKASLSTDTQYLSTDMALTFGPHGTDFLKPAKLTLKVSGLSLTAFKTYDTDRDGIVYLNLYYTSNGKWEKMNGTVKLNTTWGTLEAIDVELPHFSRYAFGI
jgi:hypothetical protein